MKKLILIKLDLQDAREKRKALKTVSALPGIDEISMDMKGKKLTIIGTVDPVRVVSRLRKFWWTEILIVRPAKAPEQEKKEEPKKELDVKKEEPPKEQEPKKEEPPKEEAKKEEPPKEEAKKEEPPKEETKKEEPKREDEDEDEDDDEEEEEIKEALKKEEVKKAQSQPPRPQPHPYPPASYRPYYPPPMHTYYQVHHSIEENPNACTIC